MFNYNFKLYLFDLINYNYYQLRRKIINFRYLEFDFDC